MTKDKFFKLYANLPINIRKEVILDMGDPIGPITWEVAYREIKTDTVLGNKIFDKLVALKFIPDDNLINE